MAEEVAGEKTEPATPRRREELRSRGQVAKSGDLNAAVVMLAGVLALYYLAPLIHADFMGMLRYYLGNYGAATAHEMMETDFVSFTVDMLYIFVRLLMPLLLALLVAALLVNFLQVGSVFSAYPLTPDLDRLNPLRGITRLISVRAVAELLKSVFKIAVVSVVCYLVLKSEFERLLTLNLWEPSPIWKLYAVLTFKMALRAALAVLVLALFDFAFQRWQFERDNRMSREEVKEEMRQLEGDPHIKGRIRRIQRQMATQRMLAEVPRAEVVVTNPVELAVALRYKQEEMSAPTVVAKGQRLMAERIKAIAVEHQVPIVENRPLAQALYKSVDVGQQIPGDLFQAVAELLAYVFQIDRRAEKLAERRRVMAA